MSQNISENNGKNPNNNQKTETALINRFSDTAPPPIPTHFCPLKKVKLRNIKGNTEQVYTQQPEEANVDRQYSCDKPP